MAKFPELKSCMSEFFGRGGISEKSVAEIGRRLQEGRLINAGKRGRYGGVEMTEYDAAAYLAGIIGAGDRRDVSTPGRDASLALGLELDRFTNFDRTQTLDPPSLELFFGLSGLHSFQDALAAIIRTERDTGLLLPDPHFAVIRLDIAVRRPWPRATIRVFGSKHLFSAHYIHPAIRTRPGTNMSAESARQKLLQLDAQFEGNEALYHVEREVGLAAIQTIADCLRGPDKDESDDAKHRKGNN